MKRKRKPAALKSDVLGGKSKSVRGKWKDHFRRLAELRDQIRDSRAGLVQDVKEEQPTFSLHTADAGTDNYDRDWALSMLSQEQDALYEIEDAMRRIRKKTYGICEMTGRPISAARLKAIPWTRFSTEAELQLEQSGKFKRTQLGERRSVVEPEMAEIESD